jgi:hypothetical protein
MRWISNTNNHKKTRKPRKHFCATQFPGTIFPFLPKPPCRPQSDEFYSVMINSFLHRIDWGTVIYKGAVVTFRIRQYWTLKHLTISGTYINQLPFAGKYSGGTTLPYRYIYTKYYFYVTGVTDETKNFMVTRLRPYPHKRTQMQARRRTHRFDL